MNDVLRQIAGLMTAQNAKQLAGIMVKLAEEINPHPPKVDSILIHDLRMAFLRLPCKNLPQKKRIRKLLSEVEEVIRNGLERQPKHASQPTVQRKTRRSKYGGVKNLTTGKVYSTLKEAAEDCGISPSAISQHMRGQSSQAGGCRWAYYNSITGEYDHVGQNH